MLPSEIYSERQRQGILVADAGQISALGVLDRLALQLKRPPSLMKQLRQRLLGAIEPQSQIISGLYLYGPVGRGKSLLMDLVFETVGTIPKRRQHFHQFMRETHQQLAQARNAGSTDPLAAVAGAIVGTVRLLCFDELFVKDIADAMILARLFTLLIEGGVLIIFTTNCAPDDLYAGGLQRARFLPFIALLKARLELVLVAGPEDHRLAHLRNAETYLTPLSAQATVQLTVLFAKLTNAAASASIVLIVDGRTLRLQRAAAGVLSSSFAELCQTPLGPNDMLEIASCFHTVLLDGVPVMGGANAENRNEALRFITLIDALYDARRNLVIAASAPAEQLYEGGPLAFEFQRTASRLIEMQAEDYQVSILANHT